MRKTVDETHTTTVERPFAFGGPYEKVRAIAEINEKGEVTTQVAIDWGRCEASQIGELIRALQKAAEWVFDQSDKLVVERRKNGDGAP